MELYEVFVKVEPSEGSVSKFVLADCIAQARRLALKYWRDRGHNAKVSYVSELGEVING